MPLLELDGRSLYYEEGGEGPPLVLTHGSIESSASWAEVAALLRDRFRVVAYDARGRGRSGPAPIGYPQMAEDLAVLVDRLELGPVLHAGHSMGGRVAVEHALARPGQVRAIASVSGRVTATAAESREKLERLLDRVRREGGGAAASMWIAPEHPLHGRVAGISAANPLEGTLAAIACARDSETLDCAGLSVPALALVGERDASPYHESARLIAESSPAGELRVLEGIGHFPNLEAPEPVAELLAGFFARYS